MFNFKIKKCSNETVVVDTTSTTRMEFLTPSQQVEYLEVESQLYGLERQRKREEKALAKRATKENTMISYIAMVAATCMTVIGMLTFNAMLFIVGIGCACVSTNLNISVVSVKKWAEKTSRKAEEYIERKFPTLWEILNS